MFYLILIISLFIFSCDEDYSNNPCNEVVLGTCNCAGDVDDCEGICGGNSRLDECGVCNGDGIPLGDCDCDGNQLDCSGVCGGNAYFDECDNCDNNVNNDCQQDCDGNWGGSLVIDECGVCGGDGLDSDEDEICDDIDDCIGQYDECGECNGDGIDEGACDCEGNVEDCAGVCGGDSQIDECGECGGDGIDVGSCDCDGNILDCEGTCDGSAYVDECGVCNDEPLDDCEQDCYGVWGGPSEACDLSSNILKISDDNEVWMGNVDGDIYGFQFDIYGIEVTSIGDGVAQSSGLTVIYENGESFTRILGYSETSAFIPTTCSTLLTLEYTGEITNVTDLVFGGQFGVPINMNYYDCSE